MKRFLVAMMTLSFFIMGLSFAHGACITDKYNFDYCTPGTNVKLTVTPEFGQLFLNFTGDKCAGSVNPCKFTMPSNSVKTQAHFTGGMVNPVTRTVYPALPGMVFQGKDGLQYKVTAPGTMQGKGRDGVWYKYTGGTSI